MTRSHEVLHAAGIKYKDVKEIKIKTLTGRYYWNVGPDHSQDTMGHENDKRTMEGHGFDSQSKSDETFVRCISATGGWRAGYVIRTSSGSMSRVDRSRLIGTECHS